MSIEGNESQTLKLQRGFRWIGPFFASLTPLAVWAFFIDRSEPPNVEGGILAVSIFAFFAVYCHLSAVRTFVRVTSYEVEVGGVLGVRTARWSDVRYAAIDRGDVVLHLISGKPLRISQYIDHIDRLVSFVEARGLFRGAAA